MKIGNFADARRAYNLARPFVKNCVEYDIDSKQKLNDEWSLIGVGSFRVCLKKGKVVYKVNIDENDNIVEYYNAEFYRNKINYKIPYCTMYHPYGYTVLAMQYIGGKFYYDFDEDEIDYLPFSDLGAYNIKVYRKSKWIIDLAR